MEMVRQLHGAQEVEMRNRELQWKLEIDRMMAQCSVQLRASQTENQRLRLELQQALAYIFEI